MQILIVYDLSGNWNNKLHWVHCPWLTGAR